MVDASDDRDDHAIMNDDESDQNKTSAKGGQERREEETEMVDLCAKWPVTTTLVWLTSMTGLVGHKNNEGREGTLLLLAWLYTSSRTIDFLADLSDEHAILLFSNR